MLSGVQGPAEKKLLHRGEKAEMERWWEGVIRNGRLWEATEHGTSKLKQAQRKRRMEAGSEGE